MRVLVTTRRTCTAEVAAALAELLISTAGEAFASATETPTNIDKLSIDNDKIFLIFSLRCLFAANLKSTAAVV